MELSFHGNFNQPHTFVPVLDLVPKFEKSFTSPSASLSTVHQCLNLQNVVTSVLILETAIDKYLLSPSMIDAVGDRHL